MTVKSITTQEHGFTTGDVVGISINNGFWKIFWHWVFQINLKRTSEYTITSVNETSFTYSTMEKS